jgi:hypothetical protein
MIDSRVQKLFWVSVVLGLWGRSSPADQAPTEAEAFETVVRPLLIGRCGKCHGAEKQRAGLRLDSREAIVAGGDSGPAIVPGNPDESLLIVAVRHADDLKMPPDRKLADEQIAALERWVEAGAPWPSALKPAAAPNPGVEAWRRHWAFQPVRDPVPPVVHDADWCRNPIDAFVLAGLERAGLSPSPRADRRTLIRRVSFDLTGLPPTPAEVETFVADPDPEAYAKLVDRLFDSPHHGEQWARHWLDVARYSDTKGYVYAREERFFVHAPAYRDWVVRAFNEDLPYDRFLLLQIAADQVAPGDRASLAALGFLTLGRRFLGVTHDIIDDRIDVVTRGTMAMTVACARCHDHKFDPIPTSDYYALYGVFQNGTERLVPIAEPAARDEAYIAFERELQRRQRALREKLTASRAEASQRVRDRLTEYLLAQRELQKFPEEGFDVVLATTDLIPASVRRWEAYLAAAAKAGDPVFLPWTAFARLPDDEFSVRAAEITREFGKVGAPAVNRLVARAFAEPPASLREVAERYGRLFAEVDRRWRGLRDEAQRRGDPVPVALPDGDEDALRRVLCGPGSPCEVPDEGIVSTESFFDSGTCAALWKLQGEVDRWLIQSPQAPAYAVALVDRETIREPRIFRRGNPANKGEEVPRHFLTAIAGPDPKPFALGSGRLELARAIVAPGNPLTARVWVNRVWQHHFGAGLVRTPSDFGLRAEAPSHPELLDWLAGRLVAGGWSTKSLHRLIVLSSAYQQGSAGPADPAARSRALQVDPENRRLWRMNARRLGFEEWRDTLQAVSGDLDRRMGGRATELFLAGAPNVRRTIYGLVDRQFLPPVLRLFDFANPDLHVPQRSETTVPQQALFALNHPFVAERARSLAAGVESTPTRERPEGIRTLYHAVYQRDPTGAQMRAALAFLDAAAAEPQPTVPPEALAWRNGYGAIDVSQGRLLGFQPLPYFNGTAWQGGPRWPDATLGWVQLTARGGHAGNDLQHAAIRRWTAPRGGTVAIKSTAIHPVDAGDGVRCWIISGRHGVLKSATVHHEQRMLDVDAIAVEAGDTLDFVVDLHGNLNNDQFLWAPEIRELAAPATTWDAARDFSGPPMSPLKPWEQLAQVLLLANELMFVD